MPLASLNLLARVIARNAAAFRGFYALTVDHARRRRGFLWQAALTLGQPETILGRPVIELIEADDIGATKSPVIFGEFTGYRIVDHVSMSILVNPYIRATDGVTRFHATRRVGGAVLQAAKFRKLKKPA
ncbi:phage major capsid protein [Rhizobium ruizarguesonis]|uniref:phage major capsid protein n=1 Tax=Rhizobium ruizarguesonis TaxID=2081791 RepID=UPI0010323D31|nr:phage major capsid protein [Rhizobium ruizarguesonis]TAZ75866.1 phage major capsid protein [Rhizobium ruizarguesonis]TAZ86783.1 phage major capsid protein [Rhizobium ruizarguesonis]